MTASGIAAGDIGFTRGRGSLVCWGIRHASGSSYSHAFVFHRLLRVEGPVEVWQTAEAWPSMDKAQAGPRLRERRVDTATEPYQRRALKVERVARTPEEAAAIVAESQRIVELNLPYGWGTIVEIGTRIPVRGKGIICSEHTYAAVTAARPRLSAYLVDMTGRVDPGQLSEACDAMTADDRGDVGAKAA